jgi:uncharacterized protein with GYD domain
MGEYVATFAFFFSYKAETWARLLANPTDRTPAVRATVEDAGGELTALYYTMGELGGLAIIEAPDPDIAAAISLVILGSGAFEAVRVQQLMTASDFVHVLTSAQESTPGYRHPGD